MRLFLGSLDEQANEMILILILISTGFDTRTVVMR